jgi:hypothetical protein
MRYFSCSGILPAKMICSDRPRDVTFSASPIAVVAKSPANNHVFQVWKSPKQLRHRVDDFIEAL